MLKGARSAIGLALVDQAMRDAEEAGQTRETSASLAMMVSYFIRQTRYLPSSSLRPVNFMPLLVFW